MTKRQEEFIRDLCKEAAIECIWDLGSMDRDETQALIDDLKSQKYELERNMGMDFVSARYSRF